MFRTSFPSLEKYTLLPRPAGSKLDASSTPEYADPTFGSVSAIVDEDRYLNTHWDHPHLGAIEMQSGAYNGTEEALRHLPPGCDFIDYRKVWLKNGPFYSGDVLQNEPDLVLVDVVFINDPILPLAYVHEQVKDFTNGFSMKNLMLDAKLKSAVSLPNGFKGLATCILELDKLLWEIRCLGREFGAGELDCSEAEFEEMTLLEAHMFLLKSKKPAWP